jgi:CheY-like chemotaxis protein
VELAQNGLRVLILEDSEDAAWSMALLLRLDGHEVRMASDGPAALEAARDDWPDVVFLDIGLPNMDGWQVAQSIQSIARRPNDKRPLLIAVTGYGREDDRRRSTEAGIDLHLVKPVEPEHLSSLLHRFRMTLS